jgi:hypothetical protein
VVSDLPWLFIGQFNEIMDNLEYFGANKQVERMMSGSREFIDDCELA